MDVGMMMVFASYGWENIRDDQVWDEEIRLARLAADSGFDVLWSEGAVAGFVKAAIWGTPDRILRELEARRGVIGEFELNTAFRFGGVPFELAEQSLKLFATEVLPVIKTWRIEDTARAAAE
jgi:hypothetical protein